MIYCRRFFYIAKAKQSDTIIVQSQTITCYNTENFFKNTMGQILHKRTTTIHKIIRKIQRQHIQHSQKIQYQLHKRKKMERAKFS